MNCQSLPLALKSAFASKSSICRNSLSQHYYYIIEYSLDIFVDIEDAYDKTSISSDSYFHRRTVVYLQQLLNSLNLDLKKSNCDKIGIIYNQMVVKGVFYCICCGYFLSIAFLIEELNSSGSVKSIIIKDPKIFKILDQKYFINTY